MIRAGLAGLAGSLVILLILETQFNGAFTDRVMYAVYAFAALAAVGVLVRILRRASRAMGRPRCGKCGRRIARGDVYCAAHGKEADYSHLERLERRR